MAHSCPDCGLMCHCGGDIEDCCFNHTPEADGCIHCLDRIDDDDDYLDDNNEDGLDG